MERSETGSTDSDDLFAVQSEMAALMAAKDWSASPLGPPSNWPASLRSVVRLLLTSRFAMWMGWGSDLTFLYNDAYRAMTLGAKHPWALGRPSREVWAEIWQDIAPRIEQVLTTGQATWDDRLMLFLERSGFSEETYHTFSYSPLIDDDGSVRGNFCVVTEETERVLSERRMALLRTTAVGIASAKTEAELFTAIETALEDSKDLPFAMIYLADDDGAGFRLVSRSGIADGHAAVPGTLDPRAESTPWRLAYDDGVAVVDLRERFPDLPAGPWPRSPERALVLPIPQQGTNRISGIMVAALNPFRPIDEPYRSFLGLLVGQIAAGLANVRAYEEERRRAQALAEIDRAKTTFFSNVSHEFRTPLTLMLGPLDYLLSHGRGEVSEIAHTELQLVRRNGQRLLKLVNTLLDFSRIEAGRVRARFEPVDLCLLTTDLASTFRSAMERAGLDYRVECEALPEPVYVDREMWEKIVLNLISNAFKFTLRGEVAVTVRKDGDRVQVAVADTGLGISEQELPRVFERFHRVEDTRGRSHEGSGIGLALVQELVKLHGGSIEVASEPGRGSVFTVSLPLGRAHLPAEHLAPVGGSGFSAAASSYAEEALRWLSLEPQEDAAARETAADPDVARVLLADDNADMREYAQRLLRERWQVESVGNGREALRAARARRPDVIVTDVMMPELDGFGLLRELRADEALRDIPVIMLSARAGEEARIEGLSASADDYLVKPFSARDLLARVDAQVAKSRMRAVEQRHARRLARIFSRAPAAVAVLSGPDHVYELTNPAYQALVGDRPVAGRGIREALPELQGQGVFEILDQVRATGEAFTGRSVHIVLNRGVGNAPEDCYFDFVYQPLFGEDGTVDTIIVIAYDVTELANAKHEAESANRLKDEFLATLSHELRTPLNAVLGYTQMVRGGIIEAERLPAVLETIERNARLQEQLISDVLDVSRIITGKLRLDVRPVDLTRVIQDALETVAPTAAAKGVRLQSTIEQPGLPVIGDAQRLQQVVWNLLANAIKFTPRGGRVDIRLERVDAHVELTVTDTGEGITPEFLPHLFQRFRQADSTFTRAHGGLGLGLAICRHLVEAHGGRVEAFSRGKGLGAVMRVDLPLNADHGLAEEPRPAGQPLDLPLSPTLALDDLRGCTILLVDDDLDALGMAQDALVAAGATVVGATSAAEALEVLDHRACDVAVLDIGMPQVDGYELLTAIRARGAEQQGNIPAIAVTAYTGSVDRARSLQAGFQMHLPKPVQPGELAAAVRVLTTAGSAKRVDPDAKSV